MSNTFTKFIDSCVGAIARKIEDEFNESDHPRDKSGKFTSKGGEGRLGADDPEYEELHRKAVEAYNKTGPMSEKERKERAKLLQKHMEETSKKKNASPLDETNFEKEAKQELSEYVGMDRKEMEQLRSEIIRKQEREPYGSDKVHKYQKQISELTKLINRSKKSEEDDEGYMGLSKEELAEEEEYENARERARREKDDDRVTGPEDRDYMNEEDDVDEHADEYEEGTSTTSLYGDKKYAPAVINALQWHYDGDSKKVGSIIRHINNITSNLELWGEYPVREIVNDIEDRYGELDQHTKDNIAVYLSKTAPSYWDPEVEYWKEKNKKHPGPKELAFYE